MCPKSFANTSSPPSSGRYAKPPPRPSARAPASRNSPPSVSQPCPCRPVGHAMALQHGGLAPTPPHGGQRLLWGTRSGWHQGQHPAQHPMDELPTPLHCSGEERAFPGVGDPWGTMALIPPFLPRVQSPSHSTLASPSRPRWPAPLSQVPVLVATEQAAAPRAGDMCHPQPLHGWIRSAWRHLLKGL